LTNYEADERNHHQPGHYQVGQVQPDLIGEATQQSRTDQERQEASQRSTRACGISSRASRPDCETDRERIKKRNA
jgi:hypothetical protein